MIFHIAKKEFINNLFTARFLVGFLLCLVLIPFSVLISIDVCRDQAAQFKLDRDAAEKAVKEVRVYSFLRPEVVLPPEPLSIFGTGISAQVGSRAKIKIGEKPLLAEGRGTAKDNPFLASFFSVDFVDIAAIVFSLLALLFSYDAFTREKEDGTLRQQMANSLGRARLLAGKVVGILMTLLPVLVFCFLLSGLIILLAGNLAFTAHEWTRLIVLAAISLLYLAVFVFIGLFVSARSKTSVTSLVFCLFLWVLFVFIIPNMSSYFAESFVGVQSRDNLARVLADLDKEFDQKAAAYKNSLPWPDWGMAGYFSNDDDGGKAMFGCSASYFERERLDSAFRDPLRIDYADKKWASQKAYLDSLDRQARAADRMATISPAGLFRQVATAVCGTDRREYQRKMDDVRRYRETFIRYFQTKAIFSSFAYITAVPPSAFRTADQLVAAHTGGEFKNLKEFESWSAKQKDFRKQFQVLDKVKIRGEAPEDYPFLDISDMPRPAEHPPSLAGRLAASGVPIALLLIESVFLFYLGFVSFLRFDVR